MEAPSKSAEDQPDPDFFNNAKAAIEKGLDKMKKIVNNINQMRELFLEMEAPSKSAEDQPDPDFFNNAKAAIEKGLDKMKKIVNNINQMRVEAAYLESDLVLMIDAPTWEEISELIGIGSIGTSSMTMDDVTVKEENKNNN